MLKYYDLWFDFCLKMASWWLMTAALVFPTFLGPGVILKDLQGVGKAVKEKQDPTKPLSH